MRDTLATWRHPGPMTAASKQPIPVTHPIDINSTPSRVSKGSWFDPVAAEDVQLPRLTRIAEEDGWDFPELRRLTHGYCADAVWKVLASLPPDLRILLRAALRAAESLQAAPAAPPGVCGGQELDPAQHIFEEMDACVWAALEIEAAGIGADGGVGFFEAEFDAATQRRGAVRLSERYAALVHGSGADGGRAALLTQYARHEVPLPAPELDFLAAVIDDLLRRTDSDGDLIQYLRVVRPRPAAGNAVPAFTPAGCRPSEAALVCVLSRARFDAGGRVTRVSGPLRLLASSGCRAAVAAAMLRGRAGLESNGEDGRRCRFSPAKSERLVVEAKGSALDLRW